MQAAVRLLLHAQETTRTAIIVCKHMELERLRAVISKLLDEAVAMDTSCCDMYHVPCSCKKVPWDLHLDAATYRAAIFVARSSRDWQYTLVLLERM
eukprot:2881907-Amphidinium_carterae.1